MSIIYRGIMHIPHLSVAFDALGQFLANAFLTNAEESPAAKKARCIRGDALHAISLLGNDPAKHTHEKTRAAGDAIMTFMCACTELGDKDKKTEAEKLLKALKAVGFKSYGDDSFFSEYAPAHIGGENHAVDFRLIGLAMAQIEQNGGKLYGQLGHALIVMSEGGPSSRNPDAHVSGQPTLHQ